MRSVFSAVPSFRKKTKLEGYLEQECTILDVDILKLQLFHLFKLQLVEFFTILNVSDNPDWKVI